MTTEQVAGLATGYRALADFIEAHPDNLAWVAGGLVIYGEEETAENVQRVARILSPCTKTFSDAFLYLRRDFTPQIGLTVAFYRKTVCTSRVVGKKHIEATFIPAHDADIVEWDCEPILEAETAATP